MSTIPHMLLLRNLFGLKSSLLDFFGCVEFALGVDCLCAHPDSTKEADKFVLLQFLVQCFNFLADLPDDPACPFLHLLLHLILLCIDIQNQFPKNLIFKCVDLPSSQCLLDQIPVCLHLSGQFLKIKIGSYPVRSISDVLYGIIHLF